MAERVDVAKLLSELYLPETTFASQAQKVNDDTAIVNHTLSSAQCAPRKTQMLQGVISVEGDKITNKRIVDEELILGHFINRGLLAGHQGFGLLLAAGSYDNPMWWTEVESISFQSRALLGDEMIAIASISKDDKSGRLVSGRVASAAGTHTRARNIRLEMAQSGDFAEPHLPQNAWLEVAAHFGGGALAALGKFPGDGYAPIYLGVGASTLPKGPAHPGDILSGVVTLKSIDELEVPDLGNMRIASVDAIISIFSARGSSGKLNFSDVEFGFASKERLWKLLNY